MPRLHTEMVVPAPIEKVWAFHAEVANLLCVIPLNMKPHLVKVHSDFGPGTEFVLRMGFGYWWVHWHARIVEADPPRRFVDEQIAGPFESFRHEHRFETLSDGRTRLVETIDYRVRRGVLGALADLLFVRWQLRGLFSFRRRALRRLLGS